MTTKRKPAEITPLPWESEYDNDTGARDEGYWEFWRVASGQFRNEADADFACRCANSHDKLVAACRDLLAIVHLQNGNLHDDTNAIQENARAALREAGET